MYSLPDARSIQWNGNVGVENDIPNYTVQHGSTISPSGNATTDTVAIQSALAAASSGEYVQLAAGTFLINGAINVPAYVVLRGMGMGQTILQGATSGLSYLVGINAGPSFGTSYGVGQVTKGSMIIATSSPHGWSVGDIVVVDQLNNQSGTPPVINYGTNGSASWVSRNNGSRAFGQLCQITSVSANGAGIQIPLYWTYDPNLTPQATKINGIRRYAGIENLTINNEISAIEPNVYLYGAVDCWLLGVEVIGSWQNGIKWQRSYRCTFRNGALHEGIPALPATGPQYGTSRSYGIYWNYVSACLVEHNALYDLDMVVKIDGPVQGNVCAYNYGGRQYYSPSMNWQVDSFVGHGANPFMNLYEGNCIMGMFRQDDIWGTANFNTFFRNRNFQDTTRHQAAFEVGQYATATYMNYVGNVFGTSGFETIYMTYPENTSVQAIYGLEPNVTASTLIHANWDTVTNGVVWNGADDHVLPQSMYLSSPPSWWNVSTPWPPIGYDVQPMFPPTPSDPIAGDPFVGYAATSTPTSAPTSTPIIHGLIYAMNQNSQLMCFTV